MFLRLSFTKVCCFFFFNCCCPYYQEGWIIYLIMRFKKKQDHISYTVSMLCLVAQSCATLCHPMDCSPPGSSVHGDSPCKSGLPFPSLGDLFNPGIQSRSLTLQVDSLLPEIPGKPKNTGVGNLSLSRASSQPRNQTRVSCIAGRFFTSWVTREAPVSEVIFNENWC